MTMNYFYGTQADRYSFIWIPKTLMTEKLFSGLQSWAKITYGFLMDRETTIDLIKGAIMSGTSQIVSPVWVHTGLTRYHCEILRGMKFSVMLETEKSLSFAV